MSRNTQRHAGFTIVELMLAMAFVSLLLLAIAGVVMQIGNIYNKGVTMKSVNQAGRLIVADMKSAIAEGEAFDTSPGSGAYRIDLGSGGQPVRGWLCTGTYSYIWNIGDGSNAASTQVTKYDNDSRVQLAKIRDTSRQYCESRYMSPTSRIPDNEATELLSEGEVTVQALTVEPVTSGSAAGTALYRIALTISNAKDGWLKNDRQCKPPDEEDSNDSFCAVNEFIFTAQSGRRGES